MIKGGPRIIKDGLVLCLDAHDAKSYAGEPVTNLVTSSAIDFSVRSGYTGNTFSQVADSESPSGYACEMSYTGTVNSASRCRFGGSNNIPTSGTGFVSIWAKKSAGSSTTMRPKIYTGYAWYHLEPLDGGSIYFTDEYRPFGVAVTFGTNSGGPNPGFSMTHAGGSTANDKTRWIKPQVTTLSYNTPFGNLSRAYNTSWRDRVSGNYAAFYNEADTRTNHYKDGQVIMPVNNSFVDFDGSNDMVTFHNNTGLFRYTPSGSTYNNSITIEVWFRIDNNDGGNIISYPWNGSGEYNWRLMENYVVFSGAGSVSISGVNDGNWHQLVGTATSTTIKAYIDGSLSGTTNHTSTYTGPTHGVTAHSFAIMTLYPYGTWAAGNTGFSTDGQFAIARIYNRELTAAEVLSNYNTTKERFS